MSIQLASIVLNDGMVWEEEFSYTGIVQEVRTTLSGAPYVFSAPILGPLVITLKSLSDQGWQTYATIKQLQLIAQVLDGQFPLVLGGRTYTVGFRHYEPPVIESTPLTPRSAYDDSDYFLLSLKLVSYLST